MNVYAKLVNFTRIIAKLIVKLSWLLNETFTTWPYFFILNSKQVSLIKNLILKFTIYRSNYYQFFEISLFLTFAEYTRTLVSKRVSNGRFRLYEFSGY